MKKLYFTILGIAVCSAMQAQTVYDALTFSQNDYYGTARSMAMGNAMTAVGSDLGSIIINPAGSAVAPYAQFTLTPALSISSVAAGLADGSGTDKTIRKRFTMPNYGVTLNFNSGKSRGLKNLTFGFIATMSDDYNRQMTSGGLTSTSYAGNLSSYARAQGYTVDEMMQAGEDMAKGYDTSVDWISVMGYKCGAIRHPEGTGDAYWAGITEEYVLEKDGELLYDTLYQNPVDMEYTQSTWGTKTDYIFNLGANISDFLFIGVNMGCITSNYRLSSTIRENAVRGQQYQNYFRDLEHNYSYNAKTSGIYGKFGIILTPVAGLRLGAAFTTPTVITVSENWQNDMTVRTYRDATGDGYSNAYASTPLSENRYKVSTPLRFNVGAAYTFGSVLMLSADYELVDYSQTRFESISRWQNNFTELNRRINGTYKEPNVDSNYDFLTRSHIVRAGAELKLIPECAIRGGYGFSTAGVAYYENGVATNLVSNTHYASFGIGYDSPKSFFFDLACRLKFCPESHVLVYSDYIAEYRSPVVQSKQLLTTVLATFGWRF